MVVCSSIQKLSSFACLTPWKGGSFNPAERALPCRFVFCRQRQDDQLQRGAEQQSVVLLSTFPYSSVLAPLCQYAGPLYFNRGPQALQEVSCALNESVSP